MSNTKFHDKDATYSLWVHYNKGNKVTHLSYDMVNGERRPQVGFNKLMKLINNKKGQYKTAIIYERATNKAIRKFRDGVEVPLNTELQ